MTLWGNDMGVHAYVHSIQFRSKETVYMLHNNGSEHFLKQQKSARLYVFHTTRT